VDRNYFGGYMGKMKQQIEQDDDIQTYKQEWVGLTDKEIYNIDFDNKSFYEAARMIEEMLKWRNT
jgi:hypothetical protein